ncbi:glycogen debranching protein GlgX [Bifidobacterium sp. BRDM6]|uniref:Glycogen debranching protein GlgX n=1 Tax=Bifidobacterium choloepi TaxID=2614131 RepID=A0A6I5NH77_9BIFI|nr:glycogen debranching protein GlgX [Bifidobacterium choloepi]NEG69663.1 glycogen debranching protein GlgX [Bifidobacterium choloepi]
MQLPRLHRYATRPGLYFDDEGGADVIVRSETAEQLWLCILEPVNGPSAFYNESVKIMDRDSLTQFFQQAHHHDIYTRVVEQLGMRETLIKMEGPNYGLWYVHLKKAWDGMQYGFRAEGAWDPAHGLRFNPNKFLLDPFGKGIDGEMTLDPAAFSYECQLEDGRIVGSPMGAISKIDSLGSVPVSVAVDDRDKAKHAGDPVHPHVPWSKTVIYEVHVKGFTANAPWLPPELRGTYAGLGHPRTLSYLQRLGVTSIELLPIQAKQPEMFLQEAGLPNYWGYSTLNFFSPEPSYATEAARRAGATAVRQEVIDMVKSLHEAGFEVLMDVVYNHTCEGDSQGPTVCWRGLDNLTFYRQQQHNVGELEDTTGCGNTIDFTNTHNVTFAADSLRYWAKRIGIDGFRFDLAVSLARLNGQFTAYHPFLYALRSDQLLGNMKLIMEPWDLGSQGWRTGQFRQPFGEWNDRFRDSARTFWISDVAQPSTNPYGNIGMQEMATRMCGSADLFATDPGRGATSSINYITSHDGFTLADLTMYVHKHNEANGENNNDGANVNHSANFGVEGPVDDPVVNRRRERTILNMLGTLLLSLGTPMLLAGDEFGNTQYGNNNAYCQDNDITWLDWDWLEDDSSPQKRMMESVAELVAIRKSLGIYTHEDFFTRLSQLGLLKPSSRVQWLLPDGTTPMESDWFNTALRSFTMRLRTSEETSVAIVVNGSRESLDFHMPRDCEWQVLWSSCQTAGETPAPSAEPGAPDNLWTFPPVTISLLTEGDLLM